MSIACFISPHGYGHAARAAAVMEAYHGLDPERDFEIFTEVPEWFFRRSLSGAFSYHSLLTDIGLVQESSLKVDLSRTTVRLDSFLPFQEKKISELAQVVTERRCKFILCDISPMGILVARRAGIPSILIENFTWDWIYEEYAADCAGLHAHVSYLGELFRRADFRIQTQPVCRPQNAHLTTSPVSRKARTSREKTRERLGIPPDAPVAMITMGGIPEAYPFLDRLQELEGVVFLIPGAGDKPSKRRNLFLLPHHSEDFHPDLVHASDALIGKVGYSTLSEVYWAGIPFGYIARDDFRESPFLISFIEKNMKGLAFSREEFTSGAFVSRLPELF
ncbi:MAG TPA: hypothetical protein VEP29_10585, partial [Desulfatiglandales bacterium]|nr:hypothetical protein [Desulfatiglandales bacterium]